MPNPLPFSGGVDVHTHHGIRLVGMPDLFLVMSRQCDLHGMLSFNAANLGLSCDEDDHCLTRVSDFEQLHWPSRTTDKSRLDT